MRPHGLSAESNELSFLQGEVARLETLARRRGRALAPAGGARLALGMAFPCGAIDVRHQLLSCRSKLVESRQALSALAARRDASIAPPSSNRAIPEGSRRRGRPRP